MLAIIVISIIVLAYFAGSVWQQHEKRKKALAEIKANWGQPKGGNFNFKQIAAYYQRQQPNTVAGNLANDIDLERLFQYVDRTYSKPGQQYLYAKLNSPEQDRHKLLDFDQLVEQVNHDGGKREIISTELYRLGSNNAYYLHQLFHYEAKLVYPVLLKLYVQVAGLLWIAAFAAMIVLHNQSLFLLLLFLTLFNFYLHYSNKQKILGFVHSLPQLKSLIEVAANINKLLPLANHHRIQQAVEALKPLKRKLGVLNIEDSVARDPTDISYAVWELVKTIFVIEPRAFINAVDQVNEHRDDINLLYHFVAETDVAISTKSFRDGLPYYCRPELITVYPNLEITDLYHPLIENCVPNSLTAHNNQGVLITGSNMSGKTTFIRSLAINTLLAQTLFTATARSYKAPLLDVCTSIDVSDNLNESKSYFQSEALAVYNIIEHMQKRNGNCLIIIDEIFRGTNTIERVAAAKAILSYLTRYSNFVFVSTHDLELAELLGSEYMPYSFEEMAIAERLVFDYKIKPGILKHKNAIAILQSMGFPNEVVTQANEVSNELAGKYK